MPAAAQSPPAANNSSFEAATIKPHNPDILGFGVNIQGRHLKTVNTSLSDLMAFAWRIQARQISGGPPWVTTERYDIEAEAAPGEAPIRNMMQNLMAERFRLTFQRETRKLPVYAIAATKDLSRLAKFPGDPNGSPTYGFRQLGVMNVNNGTMSDLAGWFQRYVMDRPVVDHSGIAGRYTFELTWRPDQFQFPDIGGQLPRPDNERPDLFTALRQQLGITMESTKADVEVFVIDHVKKPSEN